MWTDTTRAQYARADLALPSDLTDAEWAVLEPFLPPPSHVGRPRKWPLRRIIEAILYLLRGGLPWRMLPPCFPPVSTVRRWFYLWRDNGLWLSLNHALLLVGREAVGRRVAMAAANRVELGERYRRQGVWIGAASHASNPGRPRLQDTAGSTCDKANQICHDLQGATRNPMDDDEIEHRIEAFDAANGGGVGWYKDKGAYHLYLLDTEAPIARLKPTGANDEVRIGYWSHRKKWEDVDDMGGCVLPLDQALEHVATSSIFWTWT